MMLFTDAGADDDFYHIAFSTKIYSLCKRENILMCFLNLSLDFQIFSVKNLKYLHEKNS
jgi:hypothetical protein